MSNPFNEMSDSRKWRILGDAAIRAMEGEGFVPERVPGRGRSNVWEIMENGKRRRVSIRTTKGKGRGFAFPPLKKGTKWKTLDDVDIVVVAAVDNRDDPNVVEVYRFDAEEVRTRFDASYAARIQAGQTVKDNFGMWVKLDTDDRGLPRSVGSGLAAKHAPIATYPLEKLIAEYGAETANGREDGETAAKSGASGQEPHTIAEVMDWARKRIATLSGVRMEAVKLDCRIES